MSDTIPPLKALRAFEAAARHLNMTRAANELHVTPAAVSHQVILLEKHLGRKLFARLQHGLSLTPDGEAYLPHIQKGFDSFREASSALEGMATELTISVPPAFSAKWLMPRLQELRADLPAISIVNEGTNETDDRVPANVDMAIRYGRGRHRGMAVTHLLNECVIPVCHPDLLASRPKIAEVADLLQFSLLHGRASLPGEGFPDWQQWFAWAGLGDVSPPAGIEFDHHWMTVQAALEAQGIALAKRSIVMTDLVRGNLVQIVDTEYPLEFAHYAVHREAPRRPDEVAFLRLWLGRELARNVREIPAALISLSRSFRN